MQTIEILHEFHSKGIQNKYEPSRLFRYIAITHNKFAARRMCTQKYEQCYKRTMLREYVKCGEKLTNISCIFFMFSSSVLLTLFLLQEKIGANGKYFSKTKTEAPWAKKIIEKSNLFVPSKETHKVEWRLWGWRVQKIILWVIKMGKRMRVAKRESKIDSVA